MLEKNGGDDGTRTRGLCRDRATTTSKSSKSNGVGRHSLVRKDILSHCYRPLNVPRFNCVAALVFLKGDIYGLVQKSSVDTPIHFGSAEGDAKRPFRNAL